MTLAEMERRIESLEKRVQELEKRAPEVHYHQHGRAEPVFIPPTFAPGHPSEWPRVIPDVVCGGHF